MVLSPSTPDSVALNVPTWEGFSVELLSIYFFFRHTDHPIHSTKFPIHTNYLKPVQTDQESISTATFTTWEVVFSSLRINVDRRAANNDPAALCTEND